VVNPLDSGGGGLVQMKSFVLVAVLAVGMATSAMAAPIGVWSTGVCAGLNVAGCTPNTLLGFGVQDLNYTFSGFSSTNRTETAISTYVPDAAGASRWLTPGTTAGGVFPTGSYTVTTQFNLAGFNASTLNLFLDIAADNIVVAALNGTTILSCNTGGAACFSAFTFNHSIAAGGLANAGLNTLTFTVTNQNDQSPTALRVQVSGDAALAPIPEPATWGLLGVGLVGFGLLRRRLS
jgi:hypothetical protein